MFGAEAGEAEAAAGVVADQRDVAQVERLQERWDAPAVACAERSAAGAGSRWAPSGQVGTTQRTPSSRAAASSHNDPPT